LVWHPLGPNLSAMAEDDALNDSEPYASAFKLLREVQTLKYAEQFAYVLHVKARAVISDEYLDFIFIHVHAADLDFGPRPHAREFNGVGNKVDDNLF
jgi:hypothetical protein